jgi:hypothetical protein
MKQGRLPSLGKGFCQRHGFSVLRNWTRSASRFRRSSNKTRLVCLFYLYTASCWSTTTHQTRASTALPLDLSAMAHQAELIADVTVQSVSSYWSSPGGARSIHTRVICRVNRVIKGQAGAQTQFQFLGGELPNGTGLKVEGVPQFAAGERYIVFSYSPDKAMVCPILGLDQGALRVIHDDRANVDRVYRHWGQPVSEREDFSTHKATAFSTAKAQSVGSADTAEQFIQRVQVALQH